MAWVETVDSWVAIVASKVRLSTVGLTRISDLGPLSAGPESAVRPVVGVRVDACRGCSGDYWLGIRYALGTGAGRGRVGQN